MLTSRSISFNKAKLLTWVVIFAILFSMFAFHGPASVSASSEGPTGGWTELEPSADSRLIYVSNAGDDNNNGLSPASPVATITKARTLVRDGYPDWILLKRGDVWKDQDVYRFINGRSADEPAVITYYGDSGPRPLIKASTHFVNTDGAVRNYQAFVGLHIVNYKMDPSDPEFTGSNNSANMRIIGGGDYLLIEDCKLQYVEIVVQSFNGNHHTNVHINRNIVTDAYWFGSTTSNSVRPSGIYAAGIDGLTITENVFDHNGWNTAFETTKANMYNHNLYLQYDNVGNNMVVRGNIIARASSHGAQGRAGGLFEDNLFVENSIGMAFGYGEVALEAGTTAVARRNVILGGKRMMVDKATEPQTAAVWGIQLENLGQGAVTLEDNIVANRKESGGNVGIFDYAGVTYSNNIQYNWGGGIGDMSAGVNGAWADPTRSVGSYHATLGKTATLEAFLNEARGRGLGEWPEEYTAYAVNDYIREGFEEEISEVVVRNPVEDAYVYSGSPNINYGNDPLLRTNLNGDESYLKFDLSGIDNISSAKLRLYSSTAVNRHVAVFGVDPSSWTESGVTWANRPSPATAALSTVWVDISGQYYEFDVSDYVSEHTGSMISFQLQNVEQHLRTIFHSNNGTNRPELVLDLSTSESPASGWTELEPSADSRLIYVSNAGDDENDGLSPESPVATITKARTLVRDGYPDWILLKRGDVWKDQDVYRFINGRSADEPAVITYYGDSGPRPLIKASTHFVNTDGAVRNYQAFVGLHIVNYKMDPNDPEFTGSNNSANMRIIGGGDYLLIEDCKLQYVEIIVEDLNGHHHTNVHINRNIVTDAYWFGSTFSNSVRPSGIYASGIDGLTITENVFDHNGWNAAFETAQANMYNHNLYLQYDNVGNNMVVRGNIIARASSHGAQGRPGGLFEDNLFVENSIGMAFGYGEVALEAGTTAVARRNVILGGKRMMVDKASEPQTAAVWGIQLDNLGEGAVTLEDNIVANRKDNGSNDGIFDYAGVTYLNNIQYNWGGGIGDKLGGDIGAWDDPTRSVGSYHATLGKTATLEAFLNVARSRGLREWPEEYTAYAVNAYIREGFVEVEGKEIEEEEKGKRTRATKGTVQIGETIDPNWSNSVAVRDFVQSGAQSFLGHQATIEPAFKTMWDEDYLYVLTEVKDALVANSSDPALLAKAAIELYIDQTNNKASAPLRDDYLIIHVAFDGTVLKYTNGVNNLLATEHGIEASSVMTDEGYIVSVKIPWTVDTPQDRTFMGFDISVNEYNNNAEFSRRSFVHWNDITASVWQSASELGNLLLGAAEKGKHITALIGTPEVDGEVDSLWNQVDAVTDLVQSGQLILGTQAAITPSYKTLWDDNYLYVLADVRDNLVGGSTNEALLAQAAIELYIDLSNSKLDYLDKDYLQIHVAFDGSVVKYKKGAQSLLDTAHGIEAASTITNDGYVIEARIPWMNGAPQAGAVLGYDISINEYNNNAQNTRRTWIHWNDISSSVYQNAVETGNLELSGDPVLSAPAEATIAANKASASPGQAVEWTIGAGAANTGFTALELIFAYDPQVVTFDVEYDDAVAYLADGALQAAHAGYAIEGAVREDLGQIYILMFTNDNQLAITGAGPLFKLKGKVRNDAAIGQTTAVSLHSFEVSMGGEGASLDTEQASASLQVVELTTPANKEALIAKINQVQAIYNQAKTGTKIGQYRVTRKSDLEQALNAAKAVRDDAGASQSAVNAAEASLETARQTFAASIITLVEGATRVSIRDLSLIAQYYGIDSNHPDWELVAAADIEDQGVITIETLARVARMILSDWATRE